MNTYQNQVVWITGASSGIGEALAIEFAKQGAHLILSARRREALENVRESCALGGGDVLVLPLDVTDESAMPECVSQASAFKGRLDVLINNAGISQRSSCQTTEMDTYRALFEVDVFGQIALTKLVLPIMVDQGSGHLAVTSSVAGKIGVPFRTGYCAAKHAMMGFFDALRSEVTHLNIKVSTITPGFIRTNISKNALVGDGSALGVTDSNIAKGISAEECAQVIIKGLAKGKSEIAVGRGMEMHTLWIKRLFPRLLERLMADQYQKRTASDDFK